MATYTGLADANGDFTVHFSSNYKGGEKITVIAEKDSAIKSIELYAPSQMQEKAAIHFSGLATNFPNDMGEVTISGIKGGIPSNTFNASGESVLWNKATGLIIQDGVTSVGNGAFYQWRGAKSLVLPETLTSISTTAFIGWLELLEIKIPNSVRSIGDSVFQGSTKVKKVTLGSGLTSIGGYCMYPFYACEEVVCLAAIPPTITATTFFQINQSCVFKVPADSVEAYRTKEHWSAFASRIQAI